MYEYIKGILTAITPAYIVVEAGGVGYQILVANPFQFSAQRDNEIKVYVHQVIRDDAHTLYGFATLEEKQLFERLIQVSGIGPKSALAIMATADHQGLIKAIETSDITYLTRFPGVGKKTAQQMVIDLQGKLDEIALFVEEMWDLNTPQVELAEQAKVSQEAQEALKALGYSEREVKRVAKVLDKEEMTSTDEYLRQALKLMVKK